MVVGKTFTFTTDDLNSVMVNINKQITNGWTVDMIEPVMDFDKKQKFTVYLSRKD